MSSMPSITATANWIPDTNRFGLPKPPEWFLKVLWDQDPGLVVLPSRQSQKYLLARRRDRSKQMATIVRHTLNESKFQRAPLTDGDMLESRSLVLVDSISSITGNVFNASWMASCPRIMSDLRARDMWAAGGAEKFVDTLEQSEADAETRKRTKLANDLEHRASDAWRSYQARTGQRTRLATASTPPRAKIVQVGHL